MQVQLRVYVMIWPCCKDVRIDGERVRCVLDYGRAYDLMDSYVRAPHSEFLNIKGEESLAETAQGDSLPAPVTDLAANCQLLLIEIHSALCLAKSRISTAEIA